VHSSQFPASRARVLDSRTVKKDPILDLTEKDQPMFCDTRPAVHMRPMPSRTSSVSNAMLERVVGSISSQSPFNCQPQALFYASSTPCINRTMLWRSPAMTLPFTQISTRNPLTISPLLPISLPSVRSSNRCVPSILPCNECVAACNLSPQRQSRLLQGASYHRMSCAKQLRAGLATV
jgi:hypothetical protein